MIIGSEGREIKLLIEYLKGTVIMLIEVITRDFFNLEGMFSQILDPTKQKWQLHNYCLSLFSRLLATG